MIFSINGNLKKSIRDLQDSERKISSLINEPEVLDDSNLKEFEISNLIRLGLVRNIIQHYVHAEPIQFPSRSDIEYGEVSQLNVEVGIDQDYEYHNLTELGELFIKACTEKE